MATVSNIQDRLRRSTGVVTKTATATLTTAELLEGFIVAGDDTTPVVLTIPDGVAKLERKLVYIMNNGAQDLTVVYADGFGGGADTYTLLQGDMTVLVWDGTTWYGCNSTTAA
jgi:hypothetical protein